MTTTTKTLLAGAAAAALIALAGPSAAQDCPRGDLDDRYCDRDGDLVADIPEDESELLDPEDATAHCPGLRAEEFVAATYSPTDGFADPHLALQGFADALRNAQVEMLMAE